MSLFGYIFKDPWFFLLLLALPLLAVLYFGWFNKKRASVKSSNYLSSPGSSAWPIHLPFFLSIVGLGFLIVGLARPQASMDSDTVVEQFTEGIDIIVALDVSGSMLAMDFQPNRLEASKEVAKEFIAGRKHDRIGLVVYEGEAFTQCPLTTDKEVLLDLFSDVESGMVEGGTAIGMGLATAVNRLKDSDSKSKVVILLTDGVNTHGKIHPLAAAEIAKEFDVRVYTIGVGTNGKAKSPVAQDVFGRMVFDYVDVEIDEKVLTEMADITDGKYFRATDNSSLKNIYKEIDQLEKDKIKTVEFEIDAPEFFYWFAYIGGLLIALAVFLKSLIFRTLG